jgi:steroid delta-isomerase-like uncharacterized protein
MTRDEIVRFFERRQQAFNRRDAAALAELHAEDGVVESVMVGTLVGRAAIVQFYQGLFASFPDFAVESEELLIDGDRVAQLMTFGGTDVGGFMGLSPTGKHVRVPAVLLFTLNDQQIVRLRSVYDFTRMLVQIGALKVKPT